MANPKRIFIIRDGRRFFRALKMGTRVWTEKEHAARAWPERGDAEAFATRYDIPGRVVPRSRPHPLAGIDTKRRIDGVKEVGRV